MATWVGTSTVPVDGSAPASEPTNMPLGSRLQRKGKWGPYGDECLVNLLQEELIAINSLASSFKNESWIRVLAAYVQKTWEDVTIAQLKNRWKTLKKNYRLYSNLLNKSGWPWDYVLHRPTPDSPDVWDEVLKINKEYKIVKERSFPLYWKLHALAGTSTATCRYAMGSTEDNTIVEITEGSCSPGSPETQQLGDRIARVQNDVDEDDIKVLLSGRKRKRSQSASIKKSSEHTVVALERLVELSDRRSKIVEQYKDDDASYSYKLCMNSLTALPGFSAEEMYFGGQAIKQQEERIYFLSIPDTCVPFRLAQKVLEF